MGRPQKTNARERTKEGRKKVIEPPLIAEPLAFFVNHAAELRRGTGRFQATVDPKRPNALLQPLVAPKSALSGFRNKMR